MVGLWVSLICRICWKIFRKPSCKVAPVVSTRRIIGFSKKQAFPINMLLPAQQINDTTPYLRIWTHLLPLSQRIALSGFVPYIYTPSDSRDTPQPPHKRSSQRWRWWSPRCAPTLQKNYVRKVLDDPSLTLVRNPDFIKIKQKFPS